MSVKQDRPYARTATDLERRYNFGKSFAEVIGLAEDAKRTATSAEYAVSELDKSLNSKEIFNRLTNNGTTTLEFNAVRVLDEPTTPSDATNKEYVDEEVKEAKDSLKAHTDDKNNPHGVTAAQVGARPNTWMPSASDVGAVPTSRKVNNKALSSDITLSASDVGARPNTWMPTASDVGARPNTWMPSASDVGARPNTWTPTASDVGARPATYTYASKNGGDCNSYLDETHLFVFNMSNKPSAFNYGWFDVWKASGNGFSPNGAKPIIVQRFQNWQNPSRAWRTSTDGGSTWCEWMYDNPPCNGNTEYTTTERYLDKPVKTKVINLGIVAQGGTLTVAHNCSISVLVRANIVVGRFSIPYLYNGDPSSPYSITGYVNKDNVYVKNGSSNAANTVYAQIWYTNT